MKKFLLALGMLFSSATQAFANPACAVCTIAIGAGVKIAQDRGVDPVIIGLWTGALLTLLGYWTILFFDKKHWNFWGRDALLILLSVSMIGGLFISERTYEPQIIMCLFNVDPIVFGAVLGMLIYIYSQKFYQFMKAKNGGHAHFPFEKVALPVGLLIVISLVFHYYCII